MIPIIKGKSIDLKVIDESDIELLRAWRNSKDVSDYMLSRTIILKDQQEEWYKNIKDDPSVIYWIILSKEETKLGLVNLTKINRTNLSAEPGLYIGEKKYRNSFFGMEAYYHLLDYGFNRLGLEKIYGTVLSTNVVAIKMNVSFGFITEALLKEDIIIDGICSDVFKIVLNKKAFYESKTAKFFKK